MTDLCKDFEEFQEFYQKHFCDNCLKSIPGIRIKCNECIDFDLCVHCFALGAELGDHINSHSYQIIKKGGLDPFVLNKYVSSVYTYTMDDDQPCKRGVRKSTSLSSMNTRHCNIDNRSPWSAVEHIRLLKGVEHHGYGNWSEISKFVETKTMTECEKQYKKLYVNGAVGKYTLVNHVSPLSVVDRTIYNNDSPLSELSFGKLVPLSIGNYEAFHLNYCHHRDDYEDLESLHDEKVVSQIDDATDFDDLDIALNLAQCDIRQQKSIEKSRKKRLSRDHQLPSKFFATNPSLHTDILKKEKLSTAQIEKYKLQVMSEKPSSSAEMPENIKHVQYLCFTKQEIKQFTSNINHERRLITRIKQLKRYRQLGIINRFSAFKFEILKIKRIVQRNKYIEDSQARILKTNIPKCVINDAVSKYLSHLEHSFETNSKCPANKQVENIDNETPTSSMSFEGAFKAFLESTRTQNKKFVCLNEKDNSKYSYRQSLGYKINTENSRPRARVTRSTSNLSTINAMINTSLRKDIQKSHSSPQIQFLKKYELRGCKKGLVAT